MTLKRHGLSGHPADVALMFGSSGPLSVLVDQGAIVGGADLSLLCRNGASRGAARCLALLIGDGNESEHAERFPKWQHRRGPGLRCLGNAPDLYVMPPCVA